MAKQQEPLSASRDIDIRFSEVDSMQFVWHGSYSLYFEDAREAFGEKYGLGYSLIYNSGYFAPLVELHFEFKRPLVYGSKPRVTANYRSCDAAKIIFDYEIRDRDTGEIIATGRSVQVFLDRSYSLVWDNPPFYEQWKRKWLGEPCGANEVQ